jgi:hypothetical protein
VAQLETQRSGVQASVDQLRNFEREYRQSLSSFINDQLRSLESTSAPAEPPRA